MICFPDINVWIALVVVEHIHHEPATKWYGGEESNTLIFSRVTQMGVLRLLTNSHVMGRDVVSASGAWTIMDQLRRNPDIRFAAEPPGIEKVWRNLTASPQSNVNLWTDAWLAAFAISTGYTLITFDRGFGRYKDTPLEILA